MEAATTQQGRREVEDLRQRLARSLEQGGHPGLILDASGETVR